MKHYQAYMLLERGLSDNTREAYCSDVSRFLTWLDSGVGIEDITVDHLENFIYELHELGIAPRSQARIISDRKSVV